MASTLPSRGRRSSPLPNEWSPRQTVDDNFRKSIPVDNTLTKPIPDCYCHDDDRLYRRHETKTSGYRHHGGARSDHELCKLSEERTSDEESLTELEINDNAHGDVHPTYRSFDSGTKKCDKSLREYSSHGYSKSLGSHQTAQYEKVDDEDCSDVEKAVSPAPVPPYQRNLRDYVNSVNLPQALIAMRKLERLKELQRRRDLSERYYSQAIKQLIGEHFFSKNSAIDPLSGKVRELKIAESGNRAIGVTSTPGEQRIRAGGFSKKLEPCGTMTMITRLDCGCVRETTTPIFNNSIGHVKKCEGHRYQGCTVPKLIPPNPQELTYRPAQPLEKVGNADSSPIRTRARFSPDPTTYEKLQNPASRDIEPWQDRRFHSASSRIRKSPGYISPIRTTSPVQKYSDTSSNSLKE